ncbi:MAG TPA: ABC transporter ATP-binding protein, partial [Gammaproteobacteria bacterium]|nr:ABC transporter ATP-binding protein [Gammaproteobacteria bacterium]
MNSASSPEGAGPWPGDVAGSGSSTAAPSAGDQPSARAQIRRLLSYAKPYRRGWFRIAAMSTVAGVVALAQPWPLKVVVDQILGQQPPGGAIAWLVQVLPGASSRTGLLAWAALASLPLFLLSGLIEYRMALGWLRVGQRMVYDLERDLFARLQQRSLSFHSRASVGDLLARITTDSYCVYRLVDTSLITPVKSVLLAALTTLIMARMSWRLTVVAVLAAPCMGAAVFLLGRRLRSASRTKRDIESRIQAHVRQMLSGVQIVQAFGQETRESERFQDQTAAAVRAYQRTVFLGNLTDLWTGLIVAAGTGLILFIGSGLVAEGTLTVGGLLVFIAYLTALQGHFQSLARSVTSLQSLRGEMDRVMEILDHAPEIRESSTARSLPRVRGTLRFEHVSFAYETGSPVLQDVGFMAHPGETIAIVGATGAGKSTLVSLVPRFIDPDRGRVLLDGYDLRELKLAELRQNVAIVFQEPFLTPATVRENIAYGAPAASDERIVAAAKAANAHAFIADLPQGYETRLGERGMTLS